MTTTLSCIQARVARRRADGSIMKVFGFAHFYLPLLVDGRYYACLWFKHIYFVDLNNAYQKWEIL